MTRDEITALLTRWQDTIARRDVAALAAYYAEDVVLESPWVGSVKGREAIEEVYRAWFAAFPDVVVRADDLLIDGDRVAWIGTLVGTDMGGFMGLPPSRKPFRIPAVFLLTLDDHQIVRHRSVYDYVGMLVQIGVLKAKPA